MAVNNNLVAKERDRRRDEFLDVHPATAEELVEAGIYPTAEKARERLKRGERQGFVSYVAHVLNTEHRRVMLFARFEVEQPQHEYEITKLILAAQPDAARRGHQVGPFRSDAELLYGSEIVYIERERTRKSLDRVRERIGVYGNCQNEVRWIVDTDARIKNIIRTCDPPPNHRFTTYDQAVVEWHNTAIWQKNHRDAT